MASYRTLSHLQRVPSSHTEIKILWRNHKQIKRQTYSSENTENTIAAQWHVIYHKSRCLPHFHYTAKKVENMAGSGIFLTNSARCLEMSRTYHIFCQWETKTEKTKENYIRIYLCSQDQRSKHHGRDFLLFKLDESNIGAFEKGRFWWRLFGLNTILIWRHFSVHSLAILAESRLPDGRNTLVVHKRCWPEKIKFSRLTSGFQEFIKVTNRNIHIYAHPVFGFFILHKWLKENRTTSGSQSEIRCLFTPSLLLYPPLELIAEFFPRVATVTCFHFEF